MINIILSCSDSVEKINLINKKRYLFGEAIKHINVPNINDIILNVYIVDNSITSDILTEQEIKEELIKNFNLNVGKVVKIKGNFFNCLDNLNIIFDSISFVGSLKDNFLSTENDGKIKFDEQTISSFVDKLFNFIKQDNGSFFWFYKNEFRNINYKSNPLHNLINDLFDMYFDNSSNGIYTPKQNN